MKDDRLYVIHIRECLARITQYVAAGRETFMNSTLIQDATLRNLQTIGQSVGRLSSTLRGAHPQVNWRSIIGLRNVLVHDYLGVNLERIWDIIERDVPDLQRTVEAILRESDGMASDQAAANDTPPDLG